MTYKNKDMKDFRVRHNTITQQVLAFIGLIILLVIIGFISKEDCI